MMSSINQFRVRFTLSLSIGLSLSCLLFYTLTLLVQPPAQRHKNQHHDYGRTPDDDDDQHFCQWLLAYSYSQPPCTLGLRNISPSLHLDVCFNFC